MCSFFMKSFTFLRFIRALNTYIWLKNCSQRQKIAQSGSKCRKLLKSCRAQSGQAYGQLALPVGDLRRWRFCAGFEML